VKKWIVAVAVIWVLVLVAAAGVVVVLVADDDTSASSDDETSETADSPDTPDTGESGGPEEDAPAGLEEFYAQDIAWTDCGSRECGKLEVPVDYSDPSAGTIELNLKRARATGDSLGPLVVNPGGPGAPGTETAERADSYFAPALLERYDIVGFDPRGTGDSAPIDCLSDSELDAYVAADPDPDSPREVGEVVDNQEEFWEGCAANTGDLLGHVSTIEAARDMDVLRAALGDDKLDYFGFSYGTRLGATYAELFPEKVGRFVLDGAVDPSLPTLEGSLSQAKGFETALRAYLEDCIDGGSCFLGDSVEEGLATIEDLLAEIDRRPLPTNQDRDLAIGNAFFGIVTPLYSEENWTYLDQGLQEALDGQGDTLLLLSDFYGSREGGSYKDNSLEAISVINCLDDPWSVPAQEVPKYFKRFEKASPTFGRVFAWGLVGCDGIPVESTEPDIEIDGSGADPIVVIGTTRDPATPYEEAVAMAEELDSGVLVSRDGDGHTAYNSGNDCIDSAVHAYLIDGTVPEDGLSC
jgi:pimeloyl-ACP methyl ester carboxylesterase